MSVEETFLSESKTHKGLLGSFHVYVICDVFGYIYMHSKVAEHFKSFGRIQETENHNFLELGHMNIATIRSKNGHNAKYKFVFSPEVIKNRRYFCSLERNNRVSSSNLKFTSRSMRVPMRLNKISIVWGVS